jgi:hypothetical protein
MISWKSKYRREKNGIEGNGEDGWVGCEYKPTGKNEERLGGVKRYPKKEGPEWKNSDLLV